MKSSSVYNSRWNKARQSFLRTHPLCVWCSQQGQVTPATVVDHIQPHRLKEALRSGDKAAIAKAQKLFWDTSNWQGLCKLHHDSTKQRSEKSGRLQGCDEDGIPYSAHEHWGGAG